MKRYLLPLLLLLAAPAFSQAAPTDLNLTLAASGGKAIPTLTWANATATSCTATGDSAWVTAFNAASKPVAGTLTLAAVPPPNGKSYTLACAFPGDDSAVLTWIAPTQNTDGTPLTDLASYKAYYNQGDPSLVNAPGGKTKIVTAPATTTTVTTLAAGPWFFAVVATNSKGLDSDLSNVGTKTIVPGGTTSKTISFAFPNTTILTVK